MTEAERLERVADSLASVVFAMDDVDLNALLDDDARVLLESKQTLGEMTRRYRRDQHAAARNADEKPQRSSTSSEAPATDDPDDGGCGERATPADAYDLVENALQAPADERAYFIRQVLDVLPDDHRARGALEDALDTDADPDVYAALRTAYGELPPGSRQ
jgi:hypothetical protein